MSPLFVKIDLTDPANVRAQIFLNGQLISGEGGDPFAIESAERYREFAIAECCRLARLEREARTKSVLRKFGCVYER